VSLFVLEISDVNPAFTHSPRFPGDSSAATAQS